jgi:hypothetical protein
LSTKIAKGKAEKSAKPNKLSSTENVPKGHRRCSICGKISELKDFETDPRTADKHGPRHVKCRSQRFKELRKAKTLRKAKAVKVVKPSP